MTDAPACPPWALPSAASILAALRFACAEALQQGFEPQNFLLGVEQIKVLDLEAVRLRAYAFDSNCYAVNRVVGGVPVVESKAIGPWAVVLIQAAPGAYLIDARWLRR